MRDNIEAFGGDAGRVTIFGESAGAVAVSTLLAMPAAQWLFVRAIAQSGTANRLAGADNAAAVAASYLKRLGIADADPARLQSASVEQLLRAQGPRGPLSPVVDGDSLPLRPITAVRQGRASAIPLMVGTNRDEHKLYVPAQRPEIDEAELERQVAASLPRGAAQRVTDVIRVYRESRAARGLAHDRHDIADAVATPRASAFRRRACARRRRSTSRAPSCISSTGSRPRRSTLGACHGLEIPFVFGTVGKTGNDRFSGVGADAERLSRQMMDAWLGFAARGEPGHAGIGPWPAYERGQRHTMVFGRDCGVQTAPFEEERACWDSLLASDPPRASAPA